MKAPERKSHKAQQGVGMIEILVAILVVAVGVLGYAGMQMFALRGAETASYRTQATLVAKDALERILMNSAEEAGSVYFVGNNWPTTPAQAGGNFPTACIGAASCDPAALAFADVAQLSWIVTNTLPLGMIRALDNCTGAATASCIVVSWQGTTPAQCLSGGAISTSEPCVVLEAFRP